VDFWISPEGRIYPVYEVGVPHSHWAFASNRLPDSNSPVEALERLGWLHISGGTIHPPHKAIGNAQIDSLYQFLEEKKDHSLHRYYVMSLERTVQFANKDIYAY
jgi:hypothetical protein